ncbi:MAG: hypothetical protein CL590_07320 [Alteromonadaceae bacterium]|nr:hypothetical protein [Alteromonadaceae bacterium]|tara:strand:+ start:2715 stop:3950 length:1236 start_codon:yes stop_codon:yes gene_type:complete
MLNYRVRSIPHPQYGNQLLPLLVNMRHSQLPEPSAALWGWHLWLSQRYNTAKYRLQDLCVFYEYVDRHFPKFFESAAKLNIITRRQMNDLASFLLINFDYDIDDGVQVSPSTFNRRIDSIILFLQYHYSRYIEKIEDPDKADTLSRTIARLNAHLAKKRFTKAEVENQTKQTKPIGAEQINIIRDIVRPSGDNFTNEINPFRKSLQRRNACLVLLLCELGCRASELMLIRNNDNDLKLTTNPTVVIQQQETNSNQHRARKDGASHKTLGRELPISLGLASLLIEYIEEDRPLLRKPYKGALTQYLFVSEKDGGPMTTDGLNYVLDSLFRRTPDLKHVLHPHQFRVTKGGELRDGIDKNYAGSNSPMIKAGDMQDTLTTWGGWSSTSSMPKRYTNAILQKRIRTYLADKEVR